VALTLISSHRGRKRTFYGGSRNLAGRQREGETFRRRCARCGTRTIMTDSLDIRTTDLATIRRPRLLHRFCGRLIFSFIVFGLHLHAHGRPNSDVAETAGVEMLTTMSRAKGGSAHSAGERTTAVSSEGESSPKPSTRFGKKKHRRRVMLSSGSARI